MSLILHPVLQIGQILSSGFISQLMSLDFTIMATDGSSCPGEGYAEEKNCLGCL
jgi:hypothetical protein